MNIEDEVLSLSAFELAMQTLFCELCVTLIMKDPTNKYFIKKVFDNSANYVENIAIALGENANPKHTVKALKIVEEIRNSVIESTTKKK